MKTLLRVMMLVVMGAVLSSAPLRAEPTFNDISFTQEMWNPKILGRIETGARYLPRDFDTKVFPPPLNSSPETRADLDVLLKLQATERTPDNIKLCLYEDNQKVNYPIQLFEKYRLFNAKTYPKTAKLLVSVISDVDFFIIRDKKTFYRARPTQLEPRLTSLFPVPGHPAYPSGHSGQNFAMALVLGKLDPKHKDLYEKLALDIAQRREIAGVHYPSDTVAGQALARVVVDALLNVPEVEQMYAAAWLEMSKNPPKIDGIHTEDVTNAK
jgi:acid phosphatase (class A)